MMQRKPRVRDFDAEVDKLTTINARANVEYQPELLELLADVKHGSGRMEANMYGYVKHCACGWKSRERAEKAEAFREWRRHIGRTPAGGVLQRTLRKLGRSGNGA